MLMMGKSVRQVWVKMKLCVVENAIDTLSLISILISFRNINVNRGSPLDLFCIILIIFANYLKQLSLQDKSCDVSFPDNYLRQYLSFWHRLINR